MALSGTLESFSLPDVLRLLSSTKKTGLLALDGDRGRGRIWMRDGAIVDADADRAVHERIEGVAFELLRFAEASFLFESGTETAQAGEPHEVDAVLAEAEVRLAEWREIEAVVPSLDVWVRMVDELDAGRTVTPQQWRVLAQVGNGAIGHVLADRLEQGEYDVCRELRDLVVDGMVVVDETAASAPAPVRTLDVDADWESPAEPTFVDPALDDEAVSALGDDLASFVAVGTVEEPVIVDFIEPATEPEPESVPAAVADPEVVEDDDISSQLSQLSPKAAAAVEATWAGDGSVTESEPVLDAPAGSDAAPTGDDVDQNLLLRFLSSAKG